MLGQGITMLPSQLPENLFGSWVDKKNDVVLIVKKDYIVIENELWYYNEIVKENDIIYFTAVHNFNVKYVFVSWLDKTRILLNQGYKITELKKAEVDTSEKIPESFLGNWYNDKNKLQIANNQVLYLESTYVLDYIISTKDSKNYFVLYNDGEYYFCYDFNSNNSRFLHTNFSEEIIFKEESFFKKYFEAIIFAGILLAFLIGYYLLKWKIAITKKREVTKRRFVEMQLKSIRSQMNPHFLFNSLSAIQNLINKGDNEKANHYLTEFSQLMRLTLNKSEKGLVPLSDEIESIKKYLELEKLRFPFEYKIDLDQNIDINQIEIPAMLIQPFVENAIIHGLNQSKTDRKLRLDFKIELENLLCTVTDNGIGINASQAVRSKNSSEPFGLKLAKDRINLINESYHTDAKINITDISESNKDKTGTIVEIYLPLRY
jgi:Histidine kinase